MQHLYTAVFLALFLGSCGRPLQMVRIEPESETAVDRYFYGNAIQQLEQEGITVETNFYDASPEYVIFDVMVINDGREEVLFDPVATMLYTGEQQGHHALDPELELFSLDTETMHREQGRRTMAWVGGALVVAGTVYAIAGGAVPPRSRLPPAVRPTWSVTCPYHSTILPYSTSSMRSRISAPWPHLPMCRTPTTVFFGSTMPCGVLPSDPASVR